MNDFLRFASRFHKLKQDLSGVEEIEYGRLKSIESSIYLSWEQVQSLRNAAREARSDVTHIREWEAYDRYGNVLARRQAEIEHQWREVKAQVDTQQDVLRRAFMDEQTWERVVEQTATIAREEAQRKSQVEADDDALRRQFGKAELE